MVHLGKFLKNFFSYGIFHTQYLNVILVGLKKVKHPSLCKKVMVHIKILHESRGQNQYNPFYKKTLCDMKIRRIIFKVKKLLLGSPF